MGIEENKAVMRQWFQYWNENDAEALCRLYDDDEFVWAIRGYSPVSRAYGKEEARRMLTSTFEVPMQQKIHADVLHMTAEDDRVAIEFVNHGVFADGRPFENQYHMLAFLRDGKIIRGHAYLDTWTAVNSTLQKTMDEQEAAKS